ncbi:unnamed protein product [Amoebophrya sp. A120]|nr:unnamed protein product [Amoebophrya sp. A120]|eukprot:GSA120T00020865001.1
MDCPPVNPGDKSSSSSSARPVHQSGPRSPAGNMLKIPSQESREDKNQLGSSPLPPVPNDGGQQVAEDLDHVPDQQDVEDHLQAGLSSNADQEHANNFGSSTVGLLMEYVQGAGAAEDPNADDADASHAQTPFVSTQQLEKQHEKDKRALERLEKIKEQLEKRTEKDKKKLEGYNFSFRPLLCCCWKSFHPWNKERSYDEVTSTSLARLHALAIC